MSKSRIPKELQELWDAKLKDVEVNQDRREISFDPKILTEIIKRQEGKQAKTIKNKDKDRQLAAIYNAFQKLTPRQQEVITLHLGLNGCNPLTTRQIAKSLGITQQATDQCILRGLATLKKEALKNS